MTWWQRIRFSLAMLRIGRLVYTNEEYKDVWYFDDLTRRRKETAQPFKSQFRMVK
jgi:hypothetical protein